MAEVDHNTLFGLLFAILGLLIGSGGVAVFFKIRPDNKRTEADASKLQAEAWALMTNNMQCRISEQDALIRELRERIERLEQGSAEKDTRIDDLEIEITELRDWIKTQGLTPPPRKARG